MHVLPKALQRTMSRPRAASRHLAAVLVVTSVLLATSTGVAAADHAESGEVKAAQHGGEVRFVIPVSSPTQAVPGEQPVVPSQAQPAPIGFDDRNGLDESTRGPSLPFTGGRLLALVLLGLLLVLSGMAMVRAARRRSGGSAGHLAELGS
jgi:hypothetical protein